MIILFQPVQSHLQEGPKDPQEIVFLIVCSNLSTVSNLCLIDPHTIDFA
jgi:hypothetical protein